MRTNFSFSFPAGYAPENFELAFLSYILEKGTAYFRIVPSEFSASEWFCFLVKVLCWILS